MIKRLMLAVAALVLSFAANAVQLAVNPSQTDYSWVNESVGSRFASSTSFTVTALGIFDHGGDGLVHGYRVVLFDNAGTALVSADVPSGTAARLENGFRWANLTTPLGLAAGTYLVATYRPDFADRFEWVTAANVQVWAPFTLVDDNYLSGSAGDGLTPVFPTSSEDRDGIFGPGLQATVDDGTPESIPALSNWSLALMVALVGLVAIGAVRRRGL